MKLYYSPGACSLASHIVMQEAGVKFETIKVDLKTHMVAGQDFKKINPKGSVPTLETEEHQILTEGAVIMQYVADQKPDAGLMPKFGSFERYRAQEWLNFVATEIHKNFTPFFMPDTSEDLKTAARTRIGKKFDLISETLKNQTFLTGTTFTAPDSYLFTMLTWAPKCGFEMSKWPALTAFYERVKSRPAVTTAMRAEGLL